VRHQFWHLSLLVTLLVMAFFALNPFAPEAVGPNRCGAPIVRLLDPMPERVNTLVPDPGSLCNKAARDRAMVAAFAAAVGLTVTGGLALVAAFDRRSRAMTAAAS